ncbi:MAG: DNA helicase II [Proteobacteria bacterium]|nr:MAG: DNA helicase II [Pseudomonadota bacterium]QKK10940.1 MAG: DNA helicase II [Pseudomonadota bacterium]
MDVSPLLDPLNDAQREAVTTPTGQTLVLAGAGSGKTRVLIHRLAWLIQVEHVSPHGILAVTFTNKAAGEMRARAEGLLGIPVRGLWIGTFHSLAHRLLRAHYKEAKLPESFQILDSDDQYRLIRRVLKNLNVDEAHWKPKRLQWYINAKKDEGLRPEHIDPGHDAVEKQLVRLYQAYEEACQRAGLVDFAELLLRAHELWLHNPALLAHYQERFRHVLVDEFQDTNTIQYAWLRLLGGEQGNLFVVGDDDQSIYGWRGANIANIQRFHHDYPRTRMVRLEQNYRSTATILAAANAMIASNSGRLGKNLWTEDEEGDPIRRYRALSELEEAQYVIDTMAAARDRGEALSGMAVLYRSNAQSRVFEEALLRAGMPYRVYGGPRFFERMEIKDALGYLRLVAYRDDDTSFERVVNTPTRGVGQRTVEVLREQARKQNVSLWQAAQTVCQQGTLAARARNAVQAFLDLIDELAAATAEFDLAERVNHVIHASGLLEHYRMEKGEKAEARVENLEELVTAARQFVPDEAVEMGELEGFLAHAALESGEAQGEAWEDCVQLMTLHSAKGLEFNTVFLCGLEEGLFPHERSLEESDSLEEERRLCYVGMTRAKKRLFLCHAETRRMRGLERYSRPSRFIQEIPTELIEEVRMQQAAPFLSQSSVVHEFFNAPPDGYRLGQRVRHTKFGEGIVLNHEGAGSNARLQVNFEEVGAKWLVVAYAKLEALN